MYERTVTIDGKDVLLKFKDYSLIPGRISRLYTNNSELQMWESLAWGISEPQRWPIPETPAPVVVKGDDGSETTVAGTLPPIPKNFNVIRAGIFDEVSMKEVLDIHNKWQAAARVTAGESDASSD